MSTTSTDDKMSFSNIFENKKLTAEHKKKMIKQYNELIKTKKFIDWLNLNNELIENLYYEHIYDLNDKIPIQCFQLLIYYL